MTFTFLLIRINSIFDVDRYENRSNVRKPRLGDNRPVGASRFVRQTNEYNVFISTYPVQMNLSEIIYALFLEVM